MLIAGFSSGFPILTDTKGLKDALSDWRLSSPFSQLLAAARVTGAAWESIASAMERLVWISRPQATHRLWCPSNSSWGPSTCLQTLGATPPTLTPQTEWRQLGHINLCKLMIIQTNILFFFWTKMGFFLIQWNYINNIIPNLGIILWGFWLYAACNTLQSMLLLWRREMNHFWWAPFRRRALGMQRVCAWCHFPVKLWWKMRMEGRKCFSTAETA